MIPIVGWAVGTFRPIAINRGAGHSAVNQVGSRGASARRPAFTSGTGRHSRGARRDAKVRHSGAARHRNRRPWCRSRTTPDTWPRHSILKRPASSVSSLGRPSAQGTARQVNEQAAMDQGKEGDRAQPEAGHSSFRKSGTVGSALPGIWNRLLRSGAVDSAPPTYDHPRKEPR